MNRRDFLAASTAVCLSQTALAQCVPVGPGVQGCHIELPFPSVLLATTLQQCPEWCWAASISMVFKFFGHPLDQKKIVAQKYQGLPCIGAQSAQQIASDLSDDWTDDNGKSFSSSLTAAYDAQAGLLAIDNAIIINELSSQRPLLYCNTHHAMVVCAIDFRQSAQGIAVDRIFVMDPFPSAQWIHPLTQAEMIPAHLGGQMMFIASVSVDDA